MARLRIVFDLDDTLYPERDFARSGFNAAGRHAFERFGIKGLAEDMQALLESGHRGNLFGLSLKAKRPEATPEEIAELHELYRRHEPSGLKLFEDGACALDHYARQGELGLITDGHLVMQSGKVNGLGIAHRFKEIVYTDTLAPGRSMAKPHARAFQLISAALGQPGDRFVYIGDNPSKDFVAPNALGWITVWIDRPGGIHHGAKIAPGGAPQLTVQSLHELPGVLGC